jgi:hypothetical protein
MEDGSEGCARRCSANASENIDAEEMRQNVPSVFPFLYGTVFRDGSLSACAELCKPSPCNNSFSKKLWR